MDNSLLLFGVVAVGAFVFMQRQNAAAAAAAAGARQRSGSGQSFDLGFNVGFDKFGR